MTIPRKASNKCYFDRAKADAKTAELVAHGFTVAFRNKTVAGKSMIVIYYWS